MNRAGALLLLLPLLAGAAELDWKGPPFFVSSRGVRVGALLQDIGAHYRRPVVVDARVDGWFSGRLEPAAPARTLDRLANQFRLAWYYDGQALYVYPAQAVERLLVPVRVAAASDVLGALGAEAAGDGRFCRVRAVAGADALEVTGVPVCRERIASLVRRIDDSRTAADLRQQSIRVFPLMYATAGDGSYRYRNESVRIPGVVSMLREIATATDAPAATGDASAPAARAGGARPVFSVDARNNAVVVRDRPSRMGVYADLIRQLDVKPALVEISLAIIDVDAGDLEALGIDLSASASVAGGTIAFNPTQASSGGSFSTVVNDTGNFMLRLNALQQNSRARILSRPSVVTLNNVQAVLDRNITFYTKLTGEKVASLEAVATGSLLRVTPRLIDGGDKVMLTLNIQDGRQAPPLSMLETLPQVQNAEIATETALKTGQSLLLGGFVQDEEVTSERKIPLLGDIPLLGALFRSSSVNRRSVVRLFLIKAEPVRES